MIITRPLLIGLLTTAASPAFAQDALPRDDQRKTDIVVVATGQTSADSATKAETPIIEAPQTISIVSREEMDVRAVGTASDALAYTAGVNVESYGIDSRTDEIVVCGFGVSPGIAAGPLARRVRDYTPDAGADPIPAGAPAHGFATGGADAFLTFVATRVRPAVAAHWRVDSRRETLAGHSFGGLAALYDLHRFAHFDAYAAISPSLWYGGGAALPAIEPAARRGIRVLIASGSREGGPASGPGGETAAETLRAAGADARYDRLAGQSHGSTMLAAMGAIVELAFARGNSE